MKFVILSLAIWATSQTIKFLIRIVRGERISLANTSWIYQWGAGAPSTHAALLTVFVYVIGRYDSFGPLFGFSFVVALILLYNLGVERKKQLLFEAYVAASNDEALRRMVSDGKLRDMSGHGLLEVAAGIAGGVLTIAILSNFGILA